MKKLLTLSLLCMFSGLLSAQTKITIIGTVHQRTNSFNSDSILNVLNKIKPDVVLLELDTSLMDENGNYKHGFLGENEGLATRGYKNRHSDLIVRRFDLEDRNAYYRRNNTFAIEDKLNHLIDSIYSGGRFDKPSKLILDTLFDLCRQDNQMSQMDIHAVNKKSTAAFSEKKQYWMYLKQLEVIAKTPALKPYYTFYKEDGDFWIRRNKRMTENIVSYSHQFPGKNIVVLTGFTHKYLLVKNLRPLQVKERFVLCDLPE